MRNRLNAIVFLLIGVLIGWVLLPQLGTAQQYRLQQGPAFWSTANEGAKTAYLLGYLDAETIYRSNMDLKLKGLCTAAGQKWVDDFDDSFPLVEPPATIADLQKGVDDFYKNAHEPLGMFPAQRVVRLHLAGRSQFEVDAGARATQHAPSR